VNVVLRGMTWDHPRGWAPLEAATVAWRDERPDVDVRWDRRSLRAFGEAPLDDVVRSYDLVVIDHPFIGSAATSGMLVPLDDELPPETLASLAHESVGPSFSSYGFDGRSWALPIDASGQAAAWRPDLLGRLGAAVPRTWDGVLELAERSGSVALPLAPIDALSSFFTLCALAGSAPARTASRLVDADLGVASLERLASLVRSVDPACFDRTPVATLDAAANGNAIAYVPLTFAYSNHARDGFARHRLTFGDVPDGGGHGGATLGGAGIAVPAESRHRDHAIAFATWITGAERQRGIYLEHEGQPANRLAWKDDRANELTGGFFRSLLPTLDRAYLRPNRPGFAAFQREAAPLLHDSLRRARPAKETLSALEAAYARTAA
jgi:multiple sugar transport system substrate-binding protein